MCGHFRRDIKAPSLKPLLETIGMGQLKLSGGDFYPAAQVDGIIFEKEGVRQSHQAIWWFLLNKDLKPNYRYATFNARRLDSPMWARPLQTQRCIIPVTAIGESIGEKHQKKSYLMEADQAFFLGGLYNQYNNNGNLVTTFSVITRNPHPRFSKYHDKATPLFMPAEPDLIDQWLDSAVLDVSIFSDLLDISKIPVDFTVTQVNSTRKLQVVGDPEKLPRD